MPLQLLCELWGVCEAMNMQPMVFGYVLVQYPPNIVVGYLSKGE